MARDSKGRFMKGHRGEQGFKKGHGMNKGSENPMWKGDNVKYLGLHMWVRRRLGKATVCQFCGENTKMIHWANKSHEYKRDLADWFSLCVPCHRSYDKGRSDIKDNGMGR